MLIAGELELIGQEDITENERNARIAIAKTLCYHKLYLKDEELREGYDQILKRIERGTQDWDEALGEHLHELLNYRANVLMREQMSENNNSNFTRVENKRQKERRNDKETDNRIIYCQDFNTGNCIHRDHHEGRFAGKKVTRFHICKKCHSVGEMKSHREGSQNCPRKDL